MARGKPTIRDVAKAAAVSLGTVSRVLNGHESVSPEIHARVVDAIRRLGYRPNAIAQSMRTNATRTIGCVVRNLTFPMMAAFVKEAEALLNEAGYAMMISSSNDSLAHERMVLELFEQRRMDGLLLTVCDEKDPVLLRVLQRINVPIVLFDRKMELDTDSVFIDHRGGVAQATTYLLDLGHRRIGLLAGNLAVHPARESLAGFEDAVAAAGATPDPALVVCDDFSVESAYRNVSGMLALDRPPTALIAGGTLMLPGVLKAIGQAGLRIPDDISLINGCESDLAEFATPAISVIRKDFGSVGTVGAKLLLDRLEGGRPKKPRRILLPTELILRGSCGHPRAAA